ncbi:MAG TPA: hypothetical protein VEV63_17325 [Streptosporangiaceae bacterium]|nr:hypothetical protein [Streptosporangiaceae bacterium]
MRSWRTARSEAREPSESRRRGLAGRRRVALAAGVGVALVGTVAGVAAAEVTAAPAAKAPESIPHSVGHQPRAEHQQRVQHQPRAEHEGRAAGTTRQATGLQTSCRSVAHIGDSTSVDLLSPADLPNPALRLPARYAAVGVRHLNMDASGGRSIVEALPGQVNGYNVAKAWRAAGYRGCWVIAVGTNDAANVANGSAVGDAARIDQMMSVANGQPVMWVNTVTTTSSGFWANANEQAWDKALTVAAARYPNMRIFDWSAVAQPSWFLPDGIHYSPYGCAMRAKAIADALARAFPLNGRSKGDIVE